jgi:hypothetical protein
MIGIDRTAASGVFSFTKRSVNVGFYGGGIGAQLSSGNDDRLETSSRCPFTASELTEIAAALGPTLENCGKQWTCY